MSHFYLFIDVQAVVKLTILRENGGEVEECRPDSKESPEKLGEEDA